MIIDYTKNPAHAIGYSVFDATTGEKLDSKHSIFYADDQAGLIRCYRKDQDGRHIFDPGTGRPQIDELQLKINIAPRR